MTSKDDVLAALADTHNVAQFVSFGPSPDTPTPRHVRIRDVPVDVDLSAADAIERLLAASAGSVNVRAFRADTPKGNPFTYGIEAVGPALDLVRELAGGGYSTIVNETIDVHDGGVSGVRLGDLVEFAPGGTPRVVEEAGVVSVSAPMASRLLRLVYGAALPPAAADERVEFSVHPSGVGLRGERVLVWELEAGQRGRPTSVSSGVWSGRTGSASTSATRPSACSSPTPSARWCRRRRCSLARHRPSRSACPPAMTPAGCAPRRCRFAAGRFTTTDRWTDPFALLAEEDPDGTTIGAVLVQQGVDARWSGAARVDTAGALTIEGVPGAGDRFMLGERQPTEVPGEVAARVAAAAAPLVAAIGAIRLEWADDGDRCWVLQLNPLAAAREHTVTGSDVTWLAFDPVDGLDVLRAVIADATSRGAGVRVTRPVGITSHVGDLLRQAGVPTSFAR